jgi:hypothetical protein
LPISGYPGRMGASSVVMMVVMVVVTSRPAPGMVMVVMMAYELNVVLGGRDRSFFIDGL